MGNTGDLVNLCAATETDPLYTAAVNFCHGFTVGVYRVLREVDEARPAASLFCNPQPAPTRTEVIARFVQWANAGSGRLVQAPTDGFAAFLSQQFPCPTHR
jgi:hypothetical protein